LALNADSINRQHRKDLAKLRRGGTGLWSRVVMVLGAGLVLFFFVGLYWGQGGDAREFSIARQTLALSGAEWSEEFVERQDEYRAWLESYGFWFESRFFQRSSTALFRSANSLSGDQGAISFLTSLLVSLHFAALRILFIILACWKLWVLVIGGAFYWAKGAWRPYQKDDMLGQTGNGRVFYSGIRASLDEVDHEGRPGSQVVGLACPPSVSVEEAQKSEMAATLTQFGASNLTNLSLIAILLKYPDHQPYVAERDEGPKLDAAFKGSGLVKNTSELLKALLALHAEICERGRGDDLAKEKEPAVAAGATSAKDTSETYAQRIRIAAANVLSPLLISEIQKIPAAQIATIILGLEAGKVMAIGFEGGKWLRKSNFPQLSARAIVHSIAAYSRDYTTAERTLIRRAIIYGSRRSSFAAVRLPVDLSGPARAARQWAELLLCCPHELSSSAAEVELLGLVTEAHDAWAEHLAEMLRGQQRGGLDGAFSTLSNLLLVPVHSVVRILREIVPPERLRRIEQLVQLVNQKQRLDFLSSDLGDADGEKFSRAVQEHVVAPLTFSEVKDLARDHTVSMDVVKDWSALRVVLQMFGWLARRVGDYTVPPSSLIFVALKLEQRTPECNELGLLGARGMVPLRATRLIDEFGKQWSLKFVRATRAKMAVTPEQLEKFLKGAEEELPNEEADMGTQPGPVPPLSR
jgi:hypothetical protein